MAFHFFPNIHPFFQLIESSVLIGRLECLPYITPPATTTKALTPRAHSDCSSTVSVTTPSMALTRRAIAVSCYAPNARLLPAARSGVSVSALSEWNAPF